MPLNPLTGTRKGVLELCPCNVSAGYISTMVSPTFPQVLLLAPVRRHFPCLAVASGVRSFSDALGLYNLEFTGGL